MSRREGAVMALMGLVLATLITTLMTTPLVFFLKDALAGYHHDGFEHLWTFWWTFRALIEEGISPANAYLINYPVGLVNPHLTVTPYARLVALPFMSWMDPVLFYNGHLFLSFILTLVGGYLLCAEVTGERLAAVFGALIFAFFPNKTKHVLGGHFLQAIVYWFPLYALFLRRLLRRPRLKDGVLLGLFAALSLLVDLKHVAFFVIPFTLLYLAAEGIRRRDAISWRPTLKAAGVALLITVVVVSPLFVPFISDALSGRLDYYQQEGFVKHAADLLGFLVPPPEHWASRACPPLETLSVKLASEGWNENVFYLGWVATALALVGVWKGTDDERKSWLVVALGAGLLSLGPALKVAGRVLPIPLPYELLRWLPFYEWARTPGRLNETVVLAVAVLATWGAGRLLSRLGRGRKRLLLATALAAVLLVDYAVVVPWPMADTSVPAFYHQLAQLEDEPGDGAVLDLPLWDYLTGQYQLYYQTVHGRPIVGGHIFRRMPEAEAVMAEIETLAVSALAPGPDAPRRLADYGIEYVVLHRRTMPAEDLSVEMAWLADALGPPVYQDETIVVFQVPGDG